MTEPAKPDPRALAAELAGLTRSGATTEALRDCPALLSLQLVAAKSASTDNADLAVAASIVLREACASVDEQQHGPAAVVLALAQGTRGSLLKDRRRQAANALNVSDEHFRKNREELLLEAVADEIYAADSAYRLRHRHRTERQREPIDSRLGIDWRAQHQSYRRIWTPITGVRNDLPFLVEYLQDEDQYYDEICDRLCSISWHYARFSTALEQFVEEQGGLWLLADMETEIAAADAVYRLVTLAPLGAMDISWLRQLLAEATNHELEPFSDLLIEAGERRRELMGCWVRWASECDCRSADEPRCDRHRWEAAADEFIRLIDEDWYRVADWYRRIQTCFRPPPGSAASML